MAIEDTGAEERGEEYNGEAAGVAGDAATDPIPPHVRDLGDAFADGVLLGPNSDRDPDLSVVLPTLDEEAGVAECIYRIVHALHELDVSGEVVVSDDSTDRTPDIARAMGAIVVEPDERGYGYAYQYAFERCRGDYIAMGDADTTYDFGELPKLFEHVADGDADIAMGSRLEGEIEDGAMPPLHKYVGNPLLTAFLNTFYDTDISDPHSGMRVFTRDALEAMELETTGMEFASEMVMEAGAAGLEIVEEPITYHERAGEATLDSFQDGWRHLRFMLENAPGYLFTGPGVGMMTIGTLVMGSAFFGVDVGPASFGIHSLIAGCLLLVLGLQATTLGVFAKASSEPVSSSSDPLTTIITEHMPLERSIAIGTVCAGLGLAYVVLMLTRWMASGFQRMPLLRFDIVAMTAIVVGVLIVFNSFFLSVISDS